MNHDRPASPWLAANRRAAEQLDGIVEPALRDAARLAWGRGLFRSPWHLIKDPDQATWRAYRYVGSPKDDDHRYLELGVVCHLDPEGSLVGFGVDNGVDFIALHDTSEYGLRRGLDYIRQQRPQLRRHDLPMYEHKIRMMSDE